MRTIAVVTLTLCVFAASSLLAKVPLQEGITRTKEWTAEKLPGGAVLVTPTTDAYALLLDNKLKDKDRLVGAAASKLPYLSTVFDVASLASMVAAAPTKPQLRRHDFVITYTSQNLVYSPGGDGKPTGPLVPSGKPAHVAFGCRDGTLALLFGQKTGMPKAALNDAAQVVRDFKCKK